MNENCLKMIFKFVPGSKVKQELPNAQKCVNLEISFGEKNAALRQFCVNPLGKFYSPFEKPPFSVCLIQAQVLRTALIIQPTKTQKPSAYILLLPFNAVTLVTSSLAVIIGFPTNFVLRNLLFRAN